MDIKTLNIKNKLVAGTVMAVMSGAVPQLAAPALAGTATVSVSVDIVTAITLSNTNALNFGRIAITGGGPIGGDHTLNSAGVTTTAPTNGSVVTAGTPGNFDIAAGGLGAANINIAIDAAISYDGGDVLIDRLTFGGPALTTPVQVAASGNANASLGGASGDVQVGGQITFSGTPAVGAYTTDSFVVTVVDVP